MTYISFARPAVALLAVAAFAACSKASTGTAPTPSSSSSSSASVNTAPATPMMTAAMIAEGDSLYHARTCKNCHGPDLSGAKNGPSLKGPTFLHTGGRFEAIAHIITVGVPVDSIKDKSHAVAMRPRGGAAPQLTDAQIQSLAAYIYSQRVK